MSLNQEETIAERRGNELGGLIARLQKEGEDIGFRGKIILLTEGRPHISYSSDIEIKREVYGKEDSKKMAMYIRDKRPMIFNLNIAVDSDSWKMEFKGLSRPFPQAGEVYAYVKVVGDGRLGFGNDSEIRFYPA